MNSTLRYDLRPTRPSDASSYYPCRSHRRHPLLQRNLSSPSPRVSCGGSTPAEFCGGTTASCAAVCCCCPLGLVNLFVLAAYKVPRGICRRAARRNRHRKNASLPPLPSIFQNSEFAIHPFDSNDVSEDDDDDDLVDLKFIEKSSSLSTMDEDDKAVLALEKEMWNRFYGAGFWRSPSQRVSN